MIVSSKWPEFKILLLIGFSIAGLGILSTSDIAEANHGNVGVNNTGHNNIGDNNVGDNNIGNNNVGHNNVGSYNWGSNNTGNHNDGHRNQGSNNIGSDNIGDSNDGHRNHGDNNSGSDNIGDHNDGHRNQGSNNLGSDNVGCGNDGHRNHGDNNSGSDNIGDHNDGHHDIGNDIVGSNIDHGMSEVSNNIPCDGINGPNIGVSGSSIIQTKLETGGCDNDCIPPTLGVNNAGMRLVKGGLTINGEAFDVDYYYQHIPLQTLKVGETNHITLKIYEDLGAQNVAHAALFMDMSKGESVGESKCFISWDYTFNGVQTFSVTDPLKLLENVNVKGSIEENLMVVTFEFEFTKPVEPSILGTYIWDQTRNGWQNYFNEGFEVVGDSTKPEPVKAESEIRMDKITLHGIDRNNNMFVGYKENQTTLAQEKLSDILDGKSITNRHFGQNNMNQIEYNYKTRAENEKLQYSLNIENTRLMELFEKLYQFREDK